ncbi:MAG: Flp pilus assembly complex ATPase component TadA, partial [Nanoarchaeota archaeon]|nr:Flp pilus assembly complex ATPase component TadA [Nanoarchaeota archaeon]
GIIEKYNITEGGVDVEVKIVGKKGSLKSYELFHQQISPATRALLDNIKQELIGTIRITAEEILDPKRINALKEKFLEKAKELLAQKLPHLDGKMEHFLTMTLMKEMLGLGDIEILLGDPFLEEIIILSANEPIRVFHKKYGWLATNVFLRDEMQIRDYFNVIARRVGRQITTLTPLLDAHLITGDRANAVLYPISSKGNTLTIRKFARDPWTVTDFIKNKTCSAETFALIWLAMQYEANVLISGGTGSGKTSLLNVCMPFIPPNHRIISIEDTRELMLPDYLFWSPLTTRQPNPEGKGEVGMIDLLINSLRMRPDRIVLGEMRKKEQAEVLFEAMHTGHSVYATVHADSVFSTIQRLTNPPIEVPANLLMAVNLNVVMFRDRRRNIRRVYQLGEYLLQADEGKDNIKPNILYRWNPANDQLVAHQKPIRLFEELSRHTGLSEGEINNDLKEKKKVFEWMVKHDIRDVNSVGLVMKLYYLDSEELIKQINQNVDPKVILKDRDKSKW